MPTPDSDQRHRQAVWLHDTSVASSGRRDTASPARPRRTRRASQRPRATMPRWKVTNKAAGGEPARHSALDIGNSVAVLDEPAALPQSQPQLQTVETGRTILVVEDDPRVVGVIRESLELEGDAGWIVRTASDGLGALDLAFTTPPDVVLLDVRLPDLDGSEVYRRLRAGQQTRKARILFLTAGTSFDLHQRGIEDGVLLRKPFDVQDLVGIVRALLSS